VVRGGEHPELELNNPRICVAGGEFNQRRKVQASLAKSKKKGNSEKSIPHKKVITKSLPTEQDIHGDEKVSLKKKEPKKSRLGGNPSPIKS